MNVPEQPAGLPDECSDRGTPGPEARIDLVAAPVSAAADQLSAFDGVSNDSRNVVAGGLYACIVGTRFDGHEFAAAAVAAGAAGLIVQRWLDIDVAQFRVADVRVSLGPIASIVYGDPSSRLAVVGITGTNGKTTTTHLLADLLTAAGLPTAQIGTLSGARTTPEAPELQQRLQAFSRDGVQAVAMEVSSHAMAMHRVDGTRFAASVFTNFGHDHLDFHRTPEEYFRAKASLFDPIYTDVGVVNRDDRYGRKLLDSAPIEMSSYGFDDADDVDVSLSDIRFTWRGHPTRLAFGGSYNVMNALAALTTASVLGVDNAEAAGALEASRPVPGRFEPVTVAGVDPFTVIVDYAHTPDGLAALTDTARSLSGDGRIITVFGCGGDRDQEKRPLMGAAAAAGSDVVVVTSDNPRGEDPEAVIDAIVAGIPPVAGTVIVNPDRRQAIGNAISQAEPGDVVLIAGRGHETIQTIGSRDVPFDDREVAREFVEAAR